MDTALGYLDDEFSRLVDSLLEKHHVPGISIAVVDTGRVQAKGYGLARFPATPATADTLYFTGSTTKAMVAVATGMAIHEPDKVKHSMPTPLSWTTPIKSVLGENFKLEDVYAAENITIDDALSHRSGLSGHDGVYGPWLGSSPRALTRLIQYLGPLTKPLRTTMQYNNVIYAVVGDVLETITGMRCGEVLRSWLWSPLGMHQTYWHLQEALDDAHVDTNKDMSRGYYWVDNARDDAVSLQSVDGYYIPERFIDFAGVAPAGAVLSNVLDYSRWIKALLAAASPSNLGTSSIKTTSGEVSQSRPISAALFKDISTPRITVPTSNLDNAQMVPSLYALGWAVPLSTLGPLHPILAHGGGLNGYGATVFLLPNENFGVVAMANTVGSGNIVGSLLCQELIAKRMGLKLKGKEVELQAFHRLMSPEHAADLEVPAGRKPGSTRQHEDPSASNEVNVSLKLGDFVHKTEQHGEDMTRYDGIYKNPAYGEFKVLHVPAISDDAAGAGKVETRGITYRITANKALNSIKDEIRASTHSYRVEAVGQRTWKFAFLLHPRKPTEGAALSNSDTLQDLDQEYLVGHGYTEADVVPGVPTGAEDGDQNAKCRKENAWESVSWTKLGAALVEVPEKLISASLTAENGPSSRPSHRSAKRFKLGLTLANELMTQSGSREEGWGKRMMWFEQR